MKRFIAVIFAVVLAIALLPKQSLAQTRYIQDLAWKPDGSQLAVGYGDNTVEIVDPQGKLLQTFTLSGDSDGLLEQIAWRPPDGDELAVLTATTLHILNLKTGKDDSSECMFCGTFAWNSDGSLFALAGLGNGEPAFIMNGNTDEIVCSLRVPMGDYMGPVAWNPIDANIVATGAYSGKLTVWDSLTCEAVYTWQDLLKFSIDGLWWSPDGTKLVMKGVGLDIWDTSTWQPLAQVGRDYNISWSPRADHIVSVDDNVLKIIDAANGDAIQIMYVEDNLQAVAWSPDGSQIAYGGYNGTLKFISPAEVPVRATETPSAATPMSALTK